jgi:transmembrane sensor
MQCRQFIQPIVERAATYHAQMVAHDMTSAERAELEAWIHEHPEHRRVLQSMGDLSRSLRVLGSDAGKNALRDIAPGLVPVLADCESMARSVTDKQRWWPSRPWAMAIAASLLLTFAISFLYFADGMNKSAPAMLLYEASVAERKTVVLADGSSLVLNADSRILVAFTDSERRVMLERGEVFLDVAADTARPLSVFAGTHAITVVGTAFEVRYRDRPARITVHEGLVKVARTASVAPDEPVQLRVGQQLVLEPDGMPVELSPDELENSSAWRDGWLHLDNHSLEAVVSVLEPYTNKQIIIVSSRAAELKVGGSFNIDRFDSILTALESALPIKVTRHDDRIIIAHVISNDPG